MCDSDIVKKRTRTRFMRKFKNIATFILFALVMNVATVIVTLAISLYWLIDLRIGSTRTETICEQTPQQTQPAEGIPYVPETVTGWGDTPKEERLPIVLGWMEQYSKSGGAKWWEGTVPTDMEWAAYLYVREGAYWATKADDRRLLMWNIAWGVKNYGPYGYTPSTNPVPNGVFDSEDWEILTTPDDKYEESEAIARELFNDGTLERPPPYIYWVSQDELDKAIAQVGDIKWMCGTRNVEIENQGDLILLACFSDFNCVINLKC